MKRSCLFYPNVLWKCATHSLGLPSTCCILYNKPVNVKLIKHIIIHSLNDLRFYVGWKEGAYVKTKETTLLSFYVNFTYLSITNLFDGIKNFLIYSVTINCQLQQKHIYLY